MNNPLTREDLERFLDLLQGPPGELVRKDKNFKELGLDANDYSSGEAVIELLLAHPKLMQRPVVVKGDRAVLARPSAVIETLL